MNRKTTVLLASIAMIGSFSLNAQQIEVPAAQVDQVEQLDSLEQIKMIDGELSIPPLSLSDSLGFEANAEVDAMDQRYLDLLYEHDGYDYLYDNYQTDPSRLDTVALSTDTLKARLERINQSTPFQIDYNPILEELIKKKLTYKRVYLERLMTLSDYYFPMFEEHLDRFDIPLEMKYLAIVESALDPKVRSRVGATGLWQFMFATGKLQGLEINSYVDERMDPVKSTVAACKYLDWLHGIYDDWDLALAAYNSGPGNVNKAIRRSGGNKNYWNLRPYLPRETAGYVPQFQAMMYLFTYATEHGFKPQRTAQLIMATDTVQVKHKVSFEHLSQTLDLDLETIKFHNPSYKLEIIPQLEGKPQYLRLPRTQMATFVSNEDKVYAFAKAEFEKREKPLPELLKPQTSITYRVRRGDYLGKIADKYGVRISQIKKWNRLRSNKLRIGQRLKIMTRGSYTSAKKAASNKHLVKRGDSLWKISKKYGVTVNQLKKLNPDKARNLKPGMTIELK
jgi:membrane-bound lytic murein transglycosylase D